MTFAYYLSVSDISFCIRTSHPLQENEAFRPFLCEEQPSDVHVTFDEASALSFPNTKHTVFKDKCYEICMDDEGGIFRLFYEMPHDPVCYAVAKYDYLNGKICVKYLASYRRCVSELRNCFYHIGLESVLLEHNRICLHASCVTTQLGGLLFSGVSGVGKSTQAKLWCEAGKGRQINGDRPILSLELDSWRAWGSPYAGSSKCHVNENCEITAILMLKQDEECFLRRLSKPEAFRALWSGLTVHNWDKNFIEKASALTIDLIRSVPVYEFGCIPTYEAVEYLECALRKDLGL